MLIKKEKDIYELAMEQTRKDLGLIAERRRAIEDETLVLDAREIKLKALLSDLENVLSPGGEKLTIASDAPPLSIPIQKPKNGVFKWKESVLEFLKINTGKQYKSAHIFDEIYPDAKTINIKIRRSKFPNISQALTSLLEDGKIKVRVDENNGDRWYYYEG
jgi:hypothetical protein